MATGDKIVNLDDLKAVHDFTQGQVSDLKSALSEIEKEVAPKNKFDGTITAGFLDQSSGVVNSSTQSSVSDFVPVSTEFVISVDNVTNSAFRYCIYNASKAYVTGGYLPTFSTADDGRRYIVLSNANAAYVRFSDYNSRMSGAVRYMVENGDAPTEYEPYFAPYYALQDDIIIPPNQVTGLEDTMETAEKAGAFTDDASVKVIYDRYDVYTGPYTSGYVTTDGSVGSSSTLYYTDKIPVKPGTVLVGVTTDHTQDMYMRYICAYNGDTVVPSAGDSRDVKTYTVPDGIDGVVVTQRDASPRTQSIEIYCADGLTKYIIPKQPLGYMRDAGDMVDGTVLHVSENNVKNNVVIAFSANITAFDKLIIGQRARTNDVMRSYYIEIDDTNVTCNSDFGQSSSAHGLTIENDIQVQIEIGSDVSTSRIRIVSSGNVYEDTTPHRYLPDQGFAAAVSDGSTLTDCALTWTSRNINKPVWIFGDSYVSLYPQRWPYWMIQDGFDKSCMLNGFAGENSEAAVRALDNLIAIAKPQYIVWALGMNDGDSSSAVNTSWKQKFDYMINVCKQYGITPILATIPNVPTVNNSFKNAIIRASGYRYIEFSKALDPDEDANWISGALSEDNVHPTPYGAKISWQRVLVDFPEISTL